MFKPIYYLGCKSVVCDKIHSIIDDIDPDKGHVCDLFSGSGAVSASFASSRDVTSVDIQEYARVLCSSQLNPVSISPQEAMQVSDLVIKSELYNQLIDCFNPMIEFELEAINSATKDNPINLVKVIESLPLLISADNNGCNKLAVSRKETHRRLVMNDLWDRPGSTVSSYFGGSYFSFLQSVYLDAALEFAATKNGAEKDVLISSVLSTASSLVNTIGKQFAQPIRPREKSGEIKKSLVSTAIRDRSIPADFIHTKWLEKYGTITPSSKKHRSVRLGYDEALSRFGGDFSIVYADPPYTRDHYSRFYHVLETMCLRDSPRISFITKNGTRIPSRGVYREERHQSPFCIRSKAPEAFISLFRSVRELSLPLVLSYSPSEDGDGTHPRVMSASDVINIASQFFGNVDVEYLDGITHNQLNRTSLDLAKRPHSEMIIVCRL